MWRYNKYFPAVCIQYFFIGVLFLACIHLTDAVEDTSVVALCSGFGHPSKDTCPTGMTCNAEIDGQCENCTFCNALDQFDRSTSKCVCNGMGNKKLCRPGTAEARNSGAPLIKNITDAMQYMPVRVQFYNISITASYFSYCSSATTPEPETPTTEESFIMSTTLNTSTTLSPVSVATPSTAVAPVVELRCDAPHDPLHGNVIYNATPGVVDAVFACNDGYVLQGNKIISCEADKTWSGDIPTCEVFTMNHVVWIIPLSIVLLVIICGRLSYCCYRRMKRRPSNACDQDRTNTCSAVPMIPLGLTRTTSQISATTTTSGDSSQASLISGSRGSRTSSRNPSGTADSSLTDGIDSVHIPMDIFVPKMCNHSLTEVAWTTLEPKLKLLFEDEPLRTNFMEQLFPPKTSVLMRIGNLTKVSDVFKALKEESAISEVNTYAAMEKVLQAETMFPSKLHILNNLYETLRQVQVKCNNCTVKRNQTLGPDMYSGPMQVNLTVGDREVILEDQSVQT